MRKLICIGVLIIFISLLSCRRERQPLPALTTAEELIFDRPDSSLQILQSIDTTDLKQPLNRALYGMLLTMAQDKLYLKPQNDSIIHFAEEFFRKSGDTKREIYSTYYRGRVLYIKKEYSNAILTFYRALDLAESQNDFFWISMACRGLSESYLMTGNHSEELKYARLCYEAGSKAGIQPFLDYSLCDYAKASMNNKNYEDAIAMCNQLLDSSIVHKDLRLRNYAFYIKGSSFLRDEQNKEAITNLEAACNTPYANRLDTLQLTIALINDNRLAKADSLIKNIPKENGVYDPLILYFFYKQQGKIDSALSALEKVRMLENEKRRTEYRYNLPSTFAQYYETQRHLWEAESQVTQYKMIIAIIVIIVSFAIIIFSLIWIMKRRRVELNEKIHFIVELENKLKLANETNKEVSPDIRALLSSQFDLIKEIGKIQLESPSSKIGKELSRKRIETLVKQLILPNAHICKIEENIDQYMDNLASDFRKDFPSLKDSDYYLFMYYVIQLPVDLITLFLGEIKSDAVYSRKKRLKRRIQSSDIPHKDKYLRYLD